MHPPTQAGGVLALFCKPATDGCYTLPLPHKRLA
jgi:hypothetical protein